MASTLSSSMSLGMESKSTISSSSHPHPVIDIRDRAEVESVGQNRGPIEPQLTTGERDGVTLGRPPAGDHLGTRRAAYPSLAPAVHRPDVCLSGARQNIATDQRRPRPRRRARSARLYVREPAVGDTLNRNVGRAFGDY